MGSYISFAVVCFSLTDSPLQKARLRVRLGAWNSSHIPGWTYTRFFPLNKSKTKPPPNWGPIWDCQKPISRLGQRHCPACDCSLSPYAYSLSLITEAYGNAVYWSLLLMPCLVKIDLVRKRGRPLMKILVLAPHEWSLNIGYRCSMAISIYIVCYNSIQHLAARDPIQVPTHFMDIYHTKLTFSSHVTLLHRNPLQLLQRPILPQVVRL